MNTILLPVVSQRQKHSGINSTSSQAENCTTALKEIKDDNENRGCVTGY